MHAPSENGHGCFHKKNTGEGTSYTPNGLGRQETEASKRGLASGTPLARRRGTTCSFCIKGHYPTPMSQETPYFRVVAAGPHFAVSEAGQGASEEVHLAGTDQTHSSLASNSQCNEVCLQSTPGSGLTKAPS